MVLMRILPLPSCGVCAEEFDNCTRAPRVLPCGHTMCEVCILEVTNQKAVRCPFERSTSSLDIIDLPKNIAILEVLQRVRKHNFCVYKEQQRLRRLEAEAAQKTAATSEDRGCDSGNASIVSESPPSTPSRASPSPSTEDAPAEESAEERGGTQRASDVDAMESFSSEVEIQDAPPIRFLSPPPEFQAIKFVLPPPTNDPMIRITFFDTTKKLGQVLRELEFKLIDSSDTSRISDDLKLAFFSFIREGDVVLVQLYRLSNYVLGLLDLQSFFEQQFISSREKHILFRKGKHGPLKPKVGWNTFELSWHNMEALLSITE